MGAATLKARTAITLYDEMEVSLKSLEMLPDHLQVRATLDKEWSHEYSKAYARGDRMPPILVFELPDGRLVTVDGFHRVDACLSIGLKSIRAQIRPGTMHEALLAAIEANTAAFHRGRPFGEDDRKHAAEMMFADPTSNAWADARIANLCGITASTCRRYRLLYRKKTGTDLPERVEDRAGRWSHYRRAGRGRPRDLSAPSTASKDAVSNLQGILTYAGILAYPSGRLIAHAYQMGGLYCDDAVMVPASIESPESVFVAVGKLRLLRHLAKKPDARMVVVCDVVCGQRPLLDLARQDGIEFLTPDELVASLAPKA